MASIPIRKRLKPVTVEWQDILDGGGEWQDGLISPVLVRTSGFLLSQNKNHVVIVRDYYDQDGKRILGGQLAIPVGCIKRLLVLEPKA